MRNRPVEPAVSDERFGLGMTGKIELDYSLSGVREQNAQLKSGVDEDG
jgi:hypothetical protein